MSSIYLHHTNGLYSDSFMTSSSSSTIKDILYRGVNIVPIGDPGICLSVSFSSVNILFFNTVSTKSKMMSAKTYFSFRLSSHFLNLDKHSLCSMLGYDAPAYIIHKIMSSGNFITEGSLSRKCLVSFI